MDLFVAHRDLPDKSGFLNKLTGSNCEILLVTKVRDHENDFYGYTVTENMVKGKWYDKEGWELYPIGAYDISKFLFNSRKNAQKSTSLLRRTYTTADMINEALNLKLFIVNNHTVIKYISKL
jgi:hypothetical protein